MANHLAIATVTEALRLRLDAAIQGDISGADVAAKRPETGDSATSSLVTVFLYRISPNAALRNADLPTRAADGNGFRQRPTAALDLHYLLSFSGDEEQLIPQRMLGHALSTLHSMPTLTRSEIETASAGETWLEDSDLAEEVESVRFCMSSLTLDDLSKLWSVFFQTPYRLSVAYDASVVLIESNVVAREPLPVQRRGVDALPIRRPQIDRVQAVGREDGQLVGDAALEVEIFGKRLRGTRTLVRFDNDEPIAVLPDRDTHLVVPAPASAALSAGIHGLQVVHEVLLGDPATPHIGAESNLFPFVLRPGIAIALDGDEIVITFTPAVGEDQRVRLLLNELSDPPPTDRALHFFNLEPIVPVTAAPWTALRFATGDIESGTYLVRAQVDGAESMVGFTPGGGGADPQPIPTVTI